MRYLNQEPHKYYLFLPFLFSFFRFYERLPMFHNLKLAYQIIDKVSRTSQFHLYLFHT
jgi:hypothetical protein